MVEEKVASYERIVKSFFSKVNTPSFHHLDPLDYLLDSFIGLFRHIRLFYIPSKDSRVDKV